MIDLTKNELTLLKMVCKEKTNLEIMESLGYNIRTIEKIKARLCKKTNMKTNIGLFKWAVKNGYYKF